MRMMSLKKRKKMKIYWKKTKMKTLKRMMIMLLLGEEAGVGLRLRQKKD